MTVGYPSLLPSTDYDEPGDEPMRIYKSNPLKAPLRVVRLLLLGVFLPSVLVALPLYMRYHALREQAYSFAQSDMRLLDGRVSTAWCQTQTVRANGTFNAYLMPGRPEPELHRQPITMVRDLTLTDDMKEYWGFYLLRGSAVTVSTCSRWPGASLIVIKGHQHLLECAYIGDESSEEMNEVRRVQIRQQLEYRHGVDTAATPKVIGKPAIAADTPDQYEPSTVTPFPAHARPRVRANNPPNNPEKMRMVQSEGVILHQESPPSPDMYFAMDKSSQEHDEPENITETEIYERRAAAAETAMNSITQTLITSVFGRTAPTKSPEDQEQNSHEVLADVLRRLQHLGSRGSRVLRRLGQQASMENATQPSTTAEPVSSAELEKATELPPRERRHIEVARSELHKQFNRHDENMDLAMEDEEAGVKEDPALDQRIDGDGDFRDSTLSKHESHSEFWSSFSSSEEALLHCPGLVLNLPLTPHRSCQQKRPVSELHRAADANKVTYRVPTDGHYFFVFSSENEAQENFIRVQFEIDRAVYNVSRSVAYCKNSTEPCSLPLGFFSSETVVLELPVSSNDSLWNQHFVVYSTCEPRTGIFLICLVSVPLVILFFAFQ